MLKYLIIFLFFCTSCSTGHKGSSDSFSLRDYQYVKLKNGLTVLYVPDNRLPYLNLNLFIQSGSTIDPVGKSGATSLMVDLLYKGTKTRTANQISEEIEGLGADWDSSVAADYLSIGIDGLSYHDDQLLENFVDILFHASFNEVEFNKLKKLSVASMQQAFNQSSYLGQKAFSEFYFGKSLYSRLDEGTLAELSKLTIEDIKTSYNAHFIPNNALLVVTGKVSAKFQNKLKDYFSLWKPGQVPTTTIDTKVPTYSGIQILLVDKSDLNQADITIAHSGVLRTNPDYLTVNVANSILGQGFSSRLMGRIRDELGLTYNISSSFSTYKKESYFLIDTFTQTNRVGEMLKEVVKTYGDFYNAGVSDSEVSTAKNYLSGKFPMLIETAEKTAYNLAYLQMLGVSDEYLINYKKNLSKISIQDVNASIKRYFQTQNLKIVIVGNGTQIEPQLKGWAYKKVSYKQYLK